MTESSIPISVQDAAAWCLRVREGALSPSERAELEAWLNRSADNRARFLQMLDIWEGIAAEDTTIDGLAMRSAALADLQRRKSKRKMRQGLDEFSRLAFPRQIRKWLGASLCMLVLGGATFYTLQAQATVYETGKGQTQVLQLPDGSVLRLDADTRLRVRMTRLERRIWVDKGRARFEVTPDRAHALTVLVGDRRVIAAGGVLSVEHLGNQTSVTMLSGTARIDYVPSALLQFARLRSSAFTTSIGSHEELVSYDATPQAQVREADPNIDDVWKNGLLAFDNEPIAVAIARVNRYASQPVMLDRLNRQVRVSGIYRTGDTHAFVEGVCAVANLSYHEDNGAYKITEKAD
ncbi:MAG: FecR domain-containing protein [Asticcacaulis sp.]|uniref:FecR family protein n=1 Tax=Asticcacaulis sp. TaxID=1872648 RepID=UPI0039E6C10A